MALPALACAAGVALPILYLLLRAVQLDAGQILSDLLRAHNAELLLNTLALVIGVLAVVMAIAFPIAWLTARTDLPYRQLFAFVGVLPLAVPGYILAYVMLSFGGYGGPWHQLTNQRWLLSVPEGYFGAIIALGIYNTPYMFLTLRAAMRDLDPSIEEAGVSLGHSRLGVLFRLVMPQLRPAMLAGGLLVALHVIGDFGVVSLMRFETFSLALYTAYMSPTGRFAAAAPALLLIVLAILILIADAWMLRGLTLHRTTAAPRPNQTAVPLGRWKIPACLLLIAITIVCVVIPVATVCFWALQEPAAAAYKALPAAVKDSLLNSLPAALCATAAALPITILARRYPSTSSLVLERCAIAGYAIPSLAFALSLIYFTTTLIPWLYQSFIVLIAAYTIHFLAEAIGPLRSGLYLATPKLEEASRGLGLGRLRTTWKVTIPLLRHSLVVAVALVFLSVMKELPLTMLLAPWPNTLAVRVWSYSEDADFAGAAPFALCILWCSAAFVGVLLIEGRRRT